MLKKLIKHDFLSLSRVLFPLQICALAGTLLASLLMTLSLRIDQIGSSDAVTLGGGIFMGIALVLVILIGLAVGVSLLASLIVILYRFYKNFLGDEGYLTFTLPATTGQLMWSKTITGMLWMLISLAVVCLSGLIFVAFGLTDKGVMNLSVLEFIGGLFSSVGELGRYISVPLAVVEFTLYSLLTLSALLLEMYFSIIVGGQVAKTHKLLAGVGMFIVINFGVGIFKTLFRLLGWGVGGLSILTNHYSDASSFFNATMVTGIALGAVLSVGFFLWSKAILKRNLNLQ